MDTIELLVSGTYHIELKYDDIDGLPKYKKLSVKRNHLSDARYKFASKSARRRTITETVDINFKDICNIEFFAPQYTEVSIMNQKSKLLLPLKYGWVTIFYTYNL